ncbi:hypothetical protein [Burkholderia sp. ABCPW 111]|uniref:hypothetical protein n=1 Tax=Burkholderia sp. ABCPW 111 TaxID=1820025 RepID=UPI0009DD9622|nr:hypothetical protein [Burkholderia sp. ABCPW 111]
MRLGEVNDAPFGRDARRVRAARPESAVSQRARRTQPNLKGVLWSGEPPVAADFALGTARHGTAPHRATVARRRGGDAARVSDRALQRRAMSMERPSIAFAACRASCATGASIGDAIRAGMSCPRDCRSTTRRRCGARIRSRAAKARHVD